jgi:hypothetical protein
MFFSFAQGEGFNLPKGCAGLFSRGQGWIGFSHLVHVAHLFFLQFLSGSFGAS